MANFSSVRYDSETEASHYGRRRKTTPKWCQETSRVHTSLRSYPPLLGAVIIAGLGARSLPSPPLPVGSCARERLGVCGPMCARHNFPQALSDARALEGWIHSLTSSTCHVRARARSPRLPDCVNFFFCLLTVQNTLKLCSS